jgi:hypothetical protein
MMLAELAEELMELTVARKGVDLPLYAVNDISLCCCLSCTCTCD